MVGKAFFLDLGGGYRLVAFNNLLCHNLFSLSVFYFF